MGPAHGRRHRGRAARGDPLPLCTAAPRQRPYRRSGQRMTNPIGVISMTYTRPFTAEHFPLLERMKRAGMDFCEILVPEPGELDPAAVGRVAKNTGLFLALAARVNVQRD